MDAGEVAVVVLAVSVAMGVVGLLIALGSVIRAMSVFRHSVAEITASTLPLIADMHEAVTRTNEDLAKVDAMLDSAESISATVDSASRLAYTAFSSPVVKLLALWTGTARALARFRARGRRRVEPGARVRSLRPRPEGRSLRSGPPGRASLPRPRALKR